MEILQSTLNAQGFYFYYVRELIAECTDDTTLAFITTDEFTLFILNHLKDYLQEKSTHLKLYPFMNELSTMEIEKLTFFFENKDFFKGQGVYKEQEKCDGIYLVVSGKFEVMIYL